MKRSGSGPGTPILQYPLKTCAPHAYWQDANNKECEVKTMKTTRREMLAVGGSALLVAAAGRTGLDFGSELGSKETSEDLAKLRFFRLLQVPPVLSPVRTDAKTDFYEITQKEMDIELLPGKLTRVWGYEGMFPGPTIKARRGRRTIVRQTNQLPHETVVHLHGGVTESDSDGFPTDMIMPGESRSYVYSNEGRGATLWYHDHAMDRTAQNLYMGLAGLYIIEDEGEASLRLPSGEYDVPLILQDRSFGPDGNFVYHAGRGGRMGAHGTVVLVNGVPWPRFEVGKRKYRFRILNASNATVFEPALGNGRPMIQIATEGGLLSAPIECASIPLAMAERTDVIVDFSEYTIGTQIVLSNLSGKGPQSEIMRFDVAREGHDENPIPSKLGNLESLDTKIAVLTRVFDFGISVEFKIPPLTWTINGKEFNPNKSLAQVEYGEVEIWHLKNRKFGSLEMLHPVHIHLINFQILERNGEAPKPWERGWKDTVSLDNGEEVKLIMRFDGYRGRYLMHCHNLEHEDHSMMARFDVV
ncbi:MAG: multicopper oxidase domain-containing protein [Candidatus Acidiferrum sp.]